MFAKGAFVKGAPENKESTEFAMQQMSAKLNYKPELREQLIPKWKLGCRRITPGQGYLESFTQPNVHLTNSPLVSIDATGLNSKDGVHHDVDVIICAMGFDVSQIPNFSVVGRNGKSLAQKATF